MKLAFAGFRHGHIMGLYQMAMKSDEVCVTGCFEEDAEARKSAEDTYGVNFNYNSYEELLADPEVEAVAIGDYFAKRGSLAIKALESGKHVIADKPLCTDLNELKRIEELSAEKGLQVGCMLDLRYMPQIQKVKEIVQSGELGDIKIISFTGQHCLNYGSRAGWYFEEGKQGGTINDIAIHGVDVVRLITGKDFTSVNHAMEWNAFATEEPQFKDSAQFSAMMDDIVVTADISYAAPKFAGTLPTYWSFRFWGTKGMLHFNLAEKGVIRIYRETEEVIQCEPIPTTHLFDFMKEIAGVPTILSTKSVLASQRQVLEIQEAAK